jgi:branched-chain amino acid transport system substrate-binding protein
LIQTDHAIAIVDATGVDAGWAPYVQALQVPVVGSGTSSVAFNTNPDFYPEGQTMDSVIYSQVAVAKAAGTKSVGVMYCAEAPTCEEAVTPFKQAGQKQGMAVPVALKIAAATPTFAAACLASQQAGAQAMSVLQEFSVVDKVISDCTKQGYHAVWVADGLDLAPSWVSTPGGLYANVTNVPYFASLPSITTMNAAFDKYYPGMRTSANYNEIYLSLWASGILFADAAQAGGLGANGSTPTSAQLVKGLTSLHGDTLQGMASPLTFPAGQPHPVDCWFSSLSKDGKQQLPNGTNVTCAS